MAFQPGEVYPIPTPSSSSPSPSSSSPSPSLPSPHTNFHLKLKQALGHNPPLNQTRTSKIKAKGTAKYPAEFLKKEFKKIAAAGVTTSAKEANGDGNRDEAGNVLLDAAIKATAGDESGDEEME